MPLRQTTRRPKGEAKSRSARQSCGNCSAAPHPAKGRINASILPNPQACVKSDRRLCCNPLCRSLEGAVG
jgi:hypothetical protein